MLLQSAVPLSDPMDVLDRLELGGHIGSRCRSKRLVIRTDEQEVLAGTLQAALDTFPAFRDNFYACDKRRQQQLTQWWETKDARLVPLLSACSDLGNFDRRIDQPIAAKSEESKSWNLF